MLAFVFWATQPSPQEGRNDQMMQCTADAMRREGGCGKLHPPAVLRAGETTQKADLVLVRSMMDHFLVPDLMDACVPVA